MANTDSTDVFDPEVYADMAHAEFTGKVKVAGSAAVKEDNTLEGAPGSKVEFPKWNALSELADLDENTPLVPEQMGHTSSEAVIKEAGKAVEITDKAKLIGFGDAIGEAAEQFGELAARKIDADLITTAVTGLGTDYTETLPNGAGNNVLNWAKVVDFLISPFGDDWEPEDFAGLYMRSELHTQLLKDDMFVSADKLGQNGTPIARGQIGSLGGVPVFLTNRLAVRSAAMIKRGALGLLFKRRPLVERDRDILARTDLITTNIHYATKRLNDKGVAQLVIAAAAA